MAKINFLISAFIKEKWLDPWIQEERSFRAFADICDVHEGIIRKIAGEKEYRIPVETLVKICQAHNLPLSEFFQLLEEQQE